jgi:hypothetical protein
MKKSLKRKWLAALRSDEFTQTTGELRVRDFDGSVSYCCLGVLRHIMHPKSNAESKCVHDDTGYEIEGTGPGYLCSAHEKEAGLCRDVQHKLSVMNDSGKNFAQIAAYIEKDL